MVLYSIGKREPLAVRRMVISDYVAMSQQDGIANSIRSSVIRGRAGLPPFLPDFVSQGVRDALRAKFPAHFPKEQ